MKEYKYKINGSVYKVGIGDIDNGIAEVMVNGTPYKVELDQTKKAAPTVKAVKPAAAPRTPSGEKVIAKPAAKSAAGGTPVKAPLPGVVLEINVTAGQKVTASDQVMVLEAMKMENSIKAGVDGTVKSIAVNKGDSVLEGAVLITIE